MSDFVRLPSIDLRTCTVFFERKKSFLPTQAGENDDELAAVLEAQHKLNWKDGVGTKPFWRLVVLHNTGVGQAHFTASWIFHHAMSDGTSAQVFFRAFLAALNSFQPDATLNDGPIVDSPKTALVPPLEQLHKLPLTVLFMMKQSWDDTIGKRQSRLWTGAKIDRDPNSSSLKLRSITFSKDATAKLVQRCRENKATLTNMLETVVASAILANLGPQYDRVTVSGAMSLRRFLSLPDRDIEDEIGVYASSYNTMHIRPRLNSKAEFLSLDIFSWDQARTVRNVITTEIENKGKNTMVALIRWIGNQNTFWGRKIGTHRAKTIEMTNIGTWKAKPEEERGDWKVGRMTFSQDCAGCSQAFATSIATGGDGCLTLMCEWKENATEGVPMEKVVRDVRQCIEALSEGKK